MELFERALAPSLLQLMMIDYSLQIHHSSIKNANQCAYLLVSNTAMYLPLGLKRETVCCLQELHNTGPIPNQSTYPVVDFCFCWSFAQSASLYASQSIVDPPGPSFTVHVPFRYPKTCISAHRCSSAGFCQNWDNWITTKTTSGIAHWATQRSLPMKLDYSCWIGSLSKPDCNRYFEWYIRRSLVFCQLHIGKHFK